MMQFAGIAAEGLVSDDVVLTLLGKIYTIYLN